MGLRDLKWPLVSACLREGGSRYVLAAVLHVVCHGVATGLEGFRIRGPYWRAIGSTVALYSGPDGLYFML